MSDAWDEYWRTGAGQPSGCLPAAMAGMDAEQARLWGSFARSLPKGARVADLATGDGTVLRRLSSARRDLTLTGYDSARSLPPAPRGVTLKPDVAMERLPVRDGSLGAVTSQFGFEYGDIGAVAAEVARVLRPGGRVALLTHRADSPILAHNLTRAEGLRWVLDEAGLIERARAALPALSLGGTAPAEVERGPALAVERFGAGSAGWELAEAVRRSVTGRGGVEARGALAELDRLARNELGRIASLDGACARAGDGAPIHDALATAGLSKVTREDAIDADAERAFGHWIQARAAT